MPVSRMPPKIYQLLIRSHQLTIMLTLTPPTTVKELKEEVLSALLSDVCHDDDVPMVEKIKDFELSRYAKVKDQNNGAFTYQLLDEQHTLREAGLSNWENVYIQFRDASGILQPVIYTPIRTDEEEPTSPAEAEDSVTRKGKRKEIPS